MGVLQASKDLAFTVERATTWGTPIDTTPIGLPAEDMEFSYDPSNRNINRMRQTRMEDEGDSWNDMFGVIPQARVKLISTPTLNEILLPGIFQKSVDWSPAANIYTLSPQECATLPEIIADEGYFYTLMRNGLAAAQDERIAAAVMTSLKLMGNSTDDDRLLMIEAEFIGKAFEQGLTVATAITQAALTNVTAFSDLNAVTFSGVDILAEFLGFELNITNGCKFVADTPEKAIEFPKWEVNGSFRMLGGSLAEVIKGYAVDSAIDTGRLLKINYGDDPVDSDGDITIESFCVIQGKPESDFTDGEVVTFNFRGVIGGANEFPARVLFFKS